MQVTYNNALEVWEQIKNVVPEDTAKSFGPVLNPMVWNEYGKNEEITSLIETLIHEINENLELNNISLEEKKTKTKKVGGREFVITKTANRIKGGKGGKKQVAIKFEDKVVDIPKFTYKNAIKLWGDFRIKRHIMNIMHDVDFQNQLESLMAHSWDKYGKNIIVTKAIDSKIKKINDALGYKNTRIKSGKATKKQIITEAEDGIISNLEIEKMVKKAIEETKKTKTKKVGGKEITITKTANRIKSGKAKAKSKDEPKVIDFKTEVKKSKTSKKAKTPKAPKVAKPTYKRAPYWYKILQKFKNMAGKENKTTSSIQDFLLFLQGSCNSKLNKTTPHIEIIRKIQDVIYPYANNLDKTHQDLPKWESLVNECKAAMATIKISKKSGEDPSFETVTLSGHKSKSKKKSKKCK